MRTLLLGALLLASPSLAYGAETFQWKVDCICQSGAGTGQILGHVRVTKANFDEIKRMLLAGSNKSGAKVTLLGKNCGDLKMSEDRTPTPESEAEHPHCRAQNRQGHGHRRHAHEGFDLVIQRLRVGNRLMIGGNRAK